MCRSFGGDVKGYSAQIPGLTSLRFFAALWVVLYHYTWWLTPVGVPPLEVPIVAQGYLAVDFFFILSGFILTHAHHRQIERNALRPGPFLVKRLARIYPLHLATLLFYLVLVIIARWVGLKLPNPERYTVGQFALNLLLLHAMQVRDVGAWNYPSWSISAEWFAYILFPFIAAWVVRRQARRPAPLMLLAGLATFAAFYLLSKPLLGASFFELHSNYGWYRILPEFVGGILLYRIGLEGNVEWLGSTTMTRLLPVAILLACLSHAPIIAVMLFGALILATAEASRRPGNGVLTSLGLVYLGSISFALYMVHLPIATLMLKGAPLLLGVGPRDMLLPATFAALAVAAVAHHLIEMPGYRRIVHMGQKLENRHERANSDDVTFLDEPSAHPRNQYPRKADW